MQTFQEKKEAFESFVAFPNPDHSLNPLPRTLAFFDFVHIRNAFCILSKGRQNFNGRYLKRSKDALVISFSKRVDEWLQFISCDNVASTIIVAETNVSPSLLTDHERKKFIKIWTLKVFAVEHKQSD